jgi:hypothetical protein
VLAKAIATSETHRSTAYTIPLPKYLMMMRGVAEDARLEARQRQDRSTSGKRPHEKFEFK